MKYRYLFIPVLYFLLCTSVTGQEKNVFKRNASLGIHWDGLYPYPDAVRVDQNRLESVTLSDLLPRDENAVTALVVGRDNRLYGATSGKKSHLFVYDKTLKKVVHLGKIGNDPAVYHSMAVSDNGNIFIGTTRWTDPSQVKVSTRFPGGWQQSAEVMNQPDYVGGHLYVYKTTPDLTEVAIKAPVTLTDLGIPVKGEGIYSLTYDPKFNRIYGLTIPGGIVFCYEVESGSMTSFGPSTTANYLPPYTYLSRSLVAVNGDIFGSGLLGEMFKIDGKSKKLIKKTGIVLPCVKGREFLNVADVLLPSGPTFFGGTSEGYLFSCNPSTGTVQNYGRAYRENRIRGMVKGINGKYYFIAGEHPDGFCQLFSFDPETHSFESLGLIEHVAGGWLGYQFDSMAVDQEGIIYIGESGAKSHLFIYNPIQIGSN